MDDQKRRKASEKTAGVLYSDWRAANETLNSERPPTPEMMHREGYTWDKLLAYLDDHGLTGSEWDPRS